MFHFNMYLLFASNVSALASVGVWSLKQTQSVSPDAHRRAHAHRETQALNRSEHRLTHWIISTMVSHAAIRAWHTQYDCALRLERTRRSGFIAGEQETPGCSEARTRCAAASRGSLLPSRDQQHWNPENESASPLCHGRRTFEKLLEQPYAGWRQRVLSGPVGSLCQSCFI